MTLCSILKNASMPANAPHWRSEMHDEPLPVGLVAKMMFFVRELWPLSRVLLILKCWREAPRRAEKLAEAFRPNARIIIIGHTHRAGIWRIGPRIVINTGSFMMFAKRYAVDVKNNVVSVKQIVLDGGLFVAGKEIARFDATRL